MTVDKIYIAAFGGLKDYTLELHDGLNVVFGENENGKSTVAAFLKMMFYGSGKARQNLSKSPRQKYTPWSGDAMGGRVYFTHGGKRYCLERAFKKSDATDKVTLLDLDLGTSQTADAAVGQQFLGLSAAAFERSVFLDGTGAPERDESADGELNGRLSNLAVTGSETTSYTTVAERLQKAATALCSPRKVGAYDKNVALLAETEKRLEAANAAAKHRQDLENDLEKLKKRLIEIKKECDGLKTQLDREQDMRQSAKLREYLDTKAQLDAVNADLHLADGTPLNSQLITEIQLHEGNYAKRLQRLNDKKADIAPLAQSIALCEQQDGLPLEDQAAALRTQIEDLQAVARETENALHETENKIQDAERQKDAAAQRKKMPWAMLIPLLLLCTGAAAAGAVLHTAILFALAAVFATGAVLCLCLRPADKKGIAEAAQAADKLQAHRQMLLTKQADEKSRLDVLAEQQKQLEIALGTNAALLAEKKETLAAMTTQLSTLEAEVDAAAAGLTALLQRIEPAATVETVRELLTELSQRTEVQKSLKTRLKYLADDLGGISYEDAAQKLQALSGGTHETVDFDALKAQLEAKTQEGQQVYGDFQAAQNELKHAVADSENPEHIRREMADLQQTVTAQKEYHECATLCLQVLEESFAEVRRGYGSVLEQRTKEIFADITNGRYRAVGVSKDLALSAERSDVFGNYSADYFSAGTGDQLYFSLRLALSELMSDAEPLPVFLDDVFGQYDDRRAARAMAFLNGYAARSQVLLFTCHQSICTAAKELGCEIKPFAQ